MTLWEERISGTSDSLLIGEHQVRYGWARRVVEAAGTWCDLGCGTAAGSSRALADVLPERVVLVDAEHDALDEARRAFAPHDVDASTIDLTSRSDLAALADELGGGPGPIAITCFEVIEHLPDFVPVLEWLATMSADGATVAISVPNDVFTSVKNPFHVTMWGSSTVEELRGLLPTGHVVATQAALSGSVVGDGGPVDVAASIDGIGDAVPLQYLMGFGPAVADLSPHAVVLPTDVAAQRVWERQREVDNVYYRSEAVHVEELRVRIGELERELDALRSRQVPPS